MPLHPALLRRYPHLADALPWLDLGSWPTPVRPLPRLSERLGTSLYMKDDGASGDAYGGNKVRKLEPLLGAAAQQRAQSLITAGGIGSHHVVATAVYGQKLGLPLYAVVVPQPVTPQVEEALRQSLSLGVTLLPCARRPLVPLAMARARAAAPRPYLIAPGGSGPLGTLGYVAAGLELADQVAEGALPRPDTVVVTLGSGGTLAGLAIGLALADLSPALVGVRVVERRYCNAAWLRLLIERTCRLLERIGLRVPRRVPAPTILHGFCGPRYGAPTRQARQAQALAHDEEDLELDPTYTAKTMAALVASPGLIRGREILYWHTLSRVKPNVIAEDSPRRALPPAVIRWLGGELTQR